MKIIQRTLLACGLLACIPAVAQPMTEFRRHMVAGEGTAALAALERAKPGELTAKEVELRACVAKRLAGNEDAAIPSALAGHAVAPRILQAYRAYWRASLSGQRDAQAALLAALNKALAQTDTPAWDRASLDSTSNAVRSYLEKTGFHVITGVTRPYYELMLWTTQTRTDYKVDLSDQTVNVPVEFMDGFVSSGWLSYASCERYGAGGWTANGVLYALRTRYDVGSEDFRVSFLGHEGRHFADNRDFPALEQPELEYRAKLTELVISRDTTRVLLDKFVSSAKAGRAAPHSHAEYWVVTHLKQRLFKDSTRATWSTVDNDALRATAASLLAESTAAARAAGPSVKKLLPN